MTSLRGIFLVARKEAITLLEHWQAEQKIATAAKEYDLAKFCKAEIAEARKNYLAICWLLPWAANDPPGDCPLRDFYEAPPELWPYLVRHENAATL